ncbi:trehalose/maltose hydrolase-like predicted phosphorylase [Arthrobacter sp. CAN_A6]|uniref:glycoside hydrolase family 65 protein n=1 Tax=Arthrobacter sp. CAN_A6 TaxID=2787721 RepID=UPI0018CB581C
MPNFSSDAQPWSIHESGCNWDGPGVAESVFALANGYVGVRGTLDEAQPSLSPGTFMAGVYEYHPLSYPEESYGNPEHGQAIIGVADGTPIRVQVDGVPLDIRETPPEHHERVLDLRAGTLRRETQWVTPAGQRMRVVSTRLVSLTQRSVMAIHYEIEALDHAVQVVIRSELVVNGTPVQVDNADPRTGQALERPFRSCASQSDGTGGLLVHSTHGSGIGVAAAVDHAVQMPAGGQVTTQGNDEQVVTTVVADLRPGEKVGFTKYLCHVRSMDDVPADLEAQVLAAMDGARERGWEGLNADQRSFLDQFWDGADVEVGGDAELQLAIRFDLFHVLQASACLHLAPIGAKALTGSGYSGHTFWDIEGFVAPTLTLLYPEGAARLLLWRASTLGPARERAEVLGVKGASFAWRTIDGHEVSAYWPASTAAMHLNAVISLAFNFHAHATGSALPTVDGVDVLVETARMWASTVHRDDDGLFHLFGVTGPDEYTGVVDDNVFTNLMAQLNLKAAATACEVFAEHAERLGVVPSEIREWRRVADALYVPYDAELGVHPANERFTTYREWKFDTDPDSYPVQEHSHYAKIYRRQVVKQADLVLALWWCSDAFTAEQTARNLDYYEARTVRDSSLSAAAQSVVCARVGHLDLALAYLRETALTDLRDVQRNSHQGVHLAACAGAWLALVSGLGGLRADDEQLQLAPRLPDKLHRIAFRLRWRGQRIAVETTRSGTTVRLLDEGSQNVPIRIDGALLELTATHPVTSPLTAPNPATSPPRQPPGREPRH